MNLKKHTYFFGLEYRINIDRKFRLKSLQYIQRRTKKIKVKTKSWSVIEIKLWHYVLPKLKWFCFASPWTPGKGVSDAAPHCSLGGAGKGSTSQLKHEHISPSEAGSYKWASSKSKETDPAESKLSRHGGFFAV